MGIGISNWHNWSFDETKMKFFTLFQFLTGLLKSKYRNLFITFFVVRNGAMWRSCFSAPKNAKKNQLKHKTKWITGFLFAGRSSSTNIILVITGWAHKRKTFTLFSIKNNENMEIFCFHVNGYTRINTKMSFPNCMFVLMISWKCALHLYFSFLQEF